jgi:hypothetical protein
MHGYDAFELFTETDPIGEGRGGDGSGGITTAAQGSSASDKIIFHTFL